MSSEKYTPGEAAFVEAYRWANAREADGSDLAETTAEARRGIAKIKADAWDEGFNASENNIMDTPNPYRENGDNNELGR